MYNIGPAKCLFEKSYFEKLREALRPDGILCSQGRLVINFYACPQIPLETQGNPTTLLLWHRTFQY